MVSGIEPEVQPRLELPQVTLRRELLARSRIGRHGRRGVLVTEHLLEPRVQRMTGRLIECHRLPLVSVVQAGDGR
jgi:hypothetical protein